MILSEGILMKKHTNGYVSNRVLKFNVGFLLATGARNQHQTTFDVPVVRVDDDVDLEYLRGTLRLSRTKEGILTQGTLHAGLAAECARCLDDILRDLPIEIEELYAHPASITSEFSIDEDGNLDLVPLLRAEVLIADEQGALCRPDCQGLCMECGTNLNHERCACGEDDIDPRFAALKMLRDE
jgi:uncharacterized protein